MDVTVARPETAGKGPSGLIVIHVTGVRRSHGTKLKTVIVGYRAKDMD